MKPSGIITLTTDFGLRDPYVAKMKGVILSINPKARLIDVTHQIPHGNRPLAADILLETCPCFPIGTIHVAVVDPGVGGTRRPMAFTARDHAFVGPDNGLFWPLIEKHDAEDMTCLENHRFFLDNVSDTFHGRDIFSPVAAHLSLGRYLPDMGSQINDPVRLDRPCPVRDGDLLRGEIARVDHFGNLITNIHETDVTSFLQGRTPRIRIQDLALKGLHRYYENVPAGKPMALLGSSGRLEIAVNRGSAARLLGKDPEDLIGQPVEIRRYCEDDSPDPFHDMKS